MRRDSWATLRQEVAAMGLPLPGEFERRARGYLKELARWSQVSRLTGYRTEPERVERLVLDSLRWLAVLPESASPLLDIGSGVGVPGLILKLARPTWAVTLIEANRRRANFLRHVARQLEVADIRIEAGRAERLGAEPELGRRFRTVTLRAVTDPGRAVALAAPFVAPDGQVVISLGPRTPPGLGQGRVVAGPGGLGLPGGRAFLIIAGAHVAGCVPRGTGRACGLRPGDRKPERRRG
jgi:16S rRNA (guanine527-N7)-methyltransferase